MIKKLVINNYLSIGENLVFCPHDKTNIIYGENGAGKTNLLSAVFLLKKLIVSGEFMKITEEGFDNKFIDSKITSIYIQVETETIEFKYMLELDNKSKIQEILYVNDREVFHYNVNTVNANDLTVAEQLRLESYNLSSKMIITLLAKEFNLENPQIKTDVRDVYTWFKQNLVLLEQLDQNNFGVEYLQLTESQKALFLSYIKKINLPIFEINVIKNERNIPDEIVNLVKTLAGKDGFKGEFPNVKTEYVVKLLHGHDQWIGFDRESSGTKKIVSYLMKVIKNDAVTFIDDEIDTHLHYEIFKSLIDLLRSKGENQLIATTHSLDLMEDSAFMAKENFWIVEKDENEVSSIFSLKDVSGLRNDKRHNWKKMYQDYRFGGYPKKVNWND